ncbi:MAG: hypothetical protein PHC33_01315 [Candidatus Omnitrophica bacterium]|nr:hypothetical protein [Candidatus Omnitrophota bacterium]
MKRTTLLMLGGLVLVLFLLAGFFVRHYRMVDTATGNFLLPVRYNKNLRSEVKYIAGPDKKWFTQDDHIYGYYLYEFDARGRPASKECFMFKPKAFHYAHVNDLCEYWKYEYDDRGLLSKQRHYAHPGCDKQWYTGDDVEIGCTRFVFDLNGVKTREIKYNPREQEISYIIFKHDAGGRVFEDLEYGKTGKDGVWFTRDDELEKHHVYDYVENDAVCRVKEFSLKSGETVSNKTVLTDDGSANAVKIYFYNPDGSLREDRKYAGSGPDGIWFTDDDVLQYYTRYECTAAG